MGIINMLMGGHSNLKEVGEEEKQLFTSWKEIVEASANKTFDTFEPVGYTSQVVAGTVFQIKYKVGDDYLHAKVFRPLPHTGAPAEVQAVAHGQSLEAGFAF